MQDQVIKLLIKKNIISNEDIEHVIKISNNTKEEIKEILINKGFINESLLNDIFYNEFGIKNIVLDNAEIPLKVINLISKETSKKYNVIPFHKENNKIFLAMNNPLNIIAIEDIEFITRMQVIPYFERKSRIFCAIEKYYKEIKVKESIRKISKVNVENAPVVKLVNSIIDEAINSNSSDIHIEPFREGGKVRYRIDGVLRQKMIIPKEIYHLVCSRIKIKSSIDISKKMLPSDGKMEYKLNDKEFDLRISTIPTIHGEKFVIRILYKLNKIASLDNLIINTYERNKVKKILKKQNGIVLVTGPTGCGKTTTILGMINELNSMEKNIVTIEDPVEYIIPEVNQMNVNNKVGLTFSKGLRSILRQDPDIIMVGEIRDEETAEIAIKAAITGHLVLSTLHTKDSASAILRLKDMKIKEYLIADSVIAIVAQRLIRKICIHCNGKGCKVCNNSGYKGRSAIYEIMNVRDKQKEIIRHRKSVKELRESSIKDGMLTLKNYCIYLVNKGITTQEEMDRVLYGSV